MLVVCPKCGAKLQKTIGWRRDNREVSCPFGTKVYLVTDELVRIINEPEGAIGRLRSQGTRDQGTNSTVTGPCEYEAALVYTGNPARRGESRMPLRAASIM